MHDPHDLQPQEWLTRLNALVRSRMSTPFEWGVHDCCLWAADCAQAINGTDHAAAYRGTYSSAAEAMRLVQQLGGMEALGAMAGPECPPMCACVGDVGLVADPEGRELLGVCMGTVWLVPTAAGLGALPLDVGVKAWRVARD